MLFKGMIALVGGEPLGDGSDSPGPTVLVGGFLLLWLTLWTIGGIAAIHAFLRSVWAEDRLQAQGGRLVVQRATGPFRTTREFGREEIHRIAVAPYREVLTLWTPKGSVDLSDLGTAQERQDAARTLRSSLGLPDATGDAELPVLPTAWEEALTPEGERAIVPATGRRRIQAQITGAIALVLVGTAAWIAYESGNGIQSPGALPIVLVLVAIGGLIGWGALWLHRGRMEWVLGSGQLRLQKRFGGSRTVKFEAQRLEISSSTDSDGDVRFTLKAISGAGKGRTIVSRFHDPTEPRQLGAWLVRATGVSIEDQSRAAETPVDLAALQAQLEQSGKLGRWLAKGVGWVGSRKGRS